MFRQLKRLGYTAAMSAILAGCSSENDHRYPAAHAPGETMLAQVFYCRSSGHGDPGKPHEVSVGRVDMKLYSLGGNCPSVAGSNLSENCIFWITIPFRGTFDERFSFSDSWKYLEQTKDSKTADCAIVKLSDAKIDGDYAVPIENIKKTECPQIKWPFSQ